MALASQFVAALVPHAALASSSLTDPALRGALTLVVVTLALVASHWLGELASRIPPSEDDMHGEGASYTSRLMGAARAGVGPWLGRLTRASLWFAGLLAIALIWLWGTAIQPPSTGPTFLESLSEVALHAGETLVVVALALGLGRRLQVSASKSMGRGAINKNLALLGGRLIYVATLAFGFIIILGIWGTGLVFPVALLGALTVALSLALQDVLKNLVSGVYLLIERPFVIGDFITSTPYSGTVEDIRIRYTALRTIEGQRVIIPNQILFSSPVVNQSAFQRRRAALTVTLPDNGNGTPAVDDAIAAISSALSGVSGVLDQPSPQVVLNGASAGKVVLRVVFWLPTAELGETAHVLSHAIERIRTALADAEVASDTGVGAAV
ncbi:MAG: mechanosensitive ion channel family protein [Ktedonobacterales bacterium]